MRIRLLISVFLLCAVDCGAQTNPLARPCTIFDAVLLLGFGAGFSALFLIPAYRAWKWTDEWRWAALLPVVVMGFVVLRLVVDTYRDATSHNLWPFEIVMFGVGSLVFMGVVTVLRRIIGQSE